MQITKVKRSGPLVGTVRELYAGQRRLGWVTATAAGWRAEAAGGNHRRLGTYQTEAAAMAALIARRRAS
jgi:hypothetical protein